MPVLRSGEKAALKKVSCLCTRCRLLPGIFCSSPLQERALLLTQLGACAQIKAKENKAKANPTLAAENKVRLPAYS